MKLIRTFSQLGKGDAAIAGGKGASLGEMTQAGIPVPPGFVILADAFERFIEETGLVKKIEDVLATVDTEAMSTVEVASNKIQDLILTAAMPADIAGEVEKHFAALGAEHVAVRSSATAEDSASAAWAGQLDSYLNTTKAELLRNVQRCWASLFTPRAIFYRFEKGLHTTKISVAVVVQKMVHSEVSGIAFSVHPVTEDHNQLIIEAGFGLGEAIVSGQVTPDSYVVEKAPRKISEVTVSTQTRGLYRAAEGGNEWQIVHEPKASAQTLTHPQIEELSEIVLRIENHYGFPCDIEWAFAEGQFYIVQSRPITTLSPKKTGSGTSQAFDSSLPWIPYVARPYDLFGASLWYSQYVSPAMKAAFGTIMTKRLSVQYPYEITRTYHLPDELEKFTNAVRGHVAKDRAHCFEVFDRGDELNRQATLYIDGKKQFANIEEALAFMNEMMATIVVYPYFALMCLKEAGITEKDAEFVTRTEALRSTSLFIPILKEHLMPFVQKKVLSLGVDNPKALTVLTIDEVLRGDMSQVAERIENYDAGKYFVYQNLAGKDSVTYVDDTLPIIRSLDVKVSDETELRGQVAFKGIVRGPVRIVLSWDGEGAQFNEGDILVATSTNPNLLHLMKKSGAIVTDEGGIMSHAAIIARELKKPCVIGTKIASRVFNDGDMVEVDADNGIVRKI